MLGCSSGDRRQLRRHRGDNLPECGKDGSVPLLKKHRNIVHNI
jgi:hypothetical protein